MKNKMLINGTKKGLYRVDVTALARRIGRTRTWVSLVLHGHKKSRVTRELIASALGTTVEDLWAESNDSSNKAA